MNSRNSYKTKQKQMIYDFFAANPDRQFSAKEVSDSVKKQAEIGESTVYRLIKKLTEDGEIRRFSGKNVKSVVYQFANQSEHCHEHFHLKCSGCGELIHLDCGLVKEFENHMNSHHGFTIDHVKTIIYGTCAACGKMKKEQKNEKTI